jgi:hypothetical protein
MLLVYRTIRVVGLSIATRHSPFETEVSVGNPRGATYWATAVVIALLVGYTLVHVDSNSKGWIPIQKAKLTVVVMHLQGSPGHCNASLPHDERFGKLLQDHRIKLHRTEAMVPAAVRPAATDGTATSSIRCGEHKCMHAKRFCDFARANILQPLCTTTCLQ